MADEKKKNGKIIKDKLKTIINEKEDDEKRGGMRLVA